jgi:hypothetical protein
MDAQPTEQLYRVFYTTSGLRRRARTVTGETLAWMRGAWHCGIRVTSSRKATEAEAKRGAFTGSLNA